MQENDVVILPVPSAPVVLPLPPVAVPTTVDTTVLANTIHAGLVLVETVAKAQNWTTVNQVASVVDQFASNPAILTSILTLLSGNPTVAAAFEKFKTVAKSL